MGMLEQPVIAKTTTRATANLRIPIKWRGDAGEFNGAGDQPLRH
jgi:hypothetical protein